MNVFVYTPAQLHAQKKKKVQAFKNLLFRIYFIYTMIIFCLMSLTPGFSSIATNMILSSMPFMLTYIVADYYC